MPPLLLHLLLCCAVLWPCRWVVVCVQMPCNAVLCAEAERDGWIAHSPATPQA